MRRDEFYSVKEVDYETLIKYLRENSDGKEFIEPSENSITCYFSGCFTMLSPTKDNPEEIYFSVQGEPEKSEVVFRELEKILKGEIN